MTFDTIHLFQNGFLAIAVIEKQVLHTNQDGTKSEHDGQSDPSLRNCAVPNRGPISH